MTEPRQLALPFDDQQSFEAADFIEAPSNRAARTALDHEEEWVNRRLVIWGEAGSGKTHLLHLWAARRQALRLNAPSLRQAVVPEMKGFGADGIAIEDIDAPASEEALLHTLNAAQAAAVSVVLTSRQPPGRLGVRLADLASRLRASLTIQIEPAEDALLESLLLRLCAIRQISLPAPFRQHLLTWLPRRASVLHEAVARLDRAALAHGGLPSRAMAVTLLHDLLVVPEETMQPPRDSQLHDGERFL